MHKLCQSVLIEQSAARMFELVDAVETYPEFLPWCGGATVHERSEIKTVATVGINFHGVKSSFTTENEKHAPHTMLLSLRDGPFRHLQGRWTFTPLGEVACKVQFELEYAFSSRLIEMALGPAFKRITESFIESFVRRADALYPHD